MDGFHAVVFVAVVLAAGRGGGAAVVVGGWYTLLHSVLTPASLALSSC